ncbi:MAG TPA: hypothetical protein DEP87_01760 [Candidatus Pacebacteria bacterium]|nr:hypothetical protein [Candidatus Paceibacterota bacterium]
MSKLISLIQKKFPSRSGFTLLELLVVVSIVGILIAISAAAFSTAQKKSRDARRRGDIKTLQNAFEQYNSLNSGAYAAACSTMTSYSGTTILPGGIPVDPKTGVTYTCTSSTTSYCACAELDGGYGNAATADCSAIGAQSSSYDYYCLKNLQ